MTPTCEHETCDNLATYMGEGGVYLCDVPHYAPRPSVWRRFLGRTCPCRLHRLPEHPRTYPLPAGLVKVFDLCWCECDHSADEARWSA
jgi:hypothetical protein